ncbi:MAG: glycosyltransferase family 4 protein [Candidatus Hydrogenedentes bacterium]|nr:glycosyltransferase family 4 protein [Candidatus Hydrogenedentota bacterium]
MPRGKRPQGDIELKRVGIDAHAIGSRAGGNETYMRELLFALREHAPRRDFVVYAQRGVSPTMLAGWPVVPLPRASSFLRVPITLPRAVQRSGADLLHVQYNAPPVSPCPFVVSVHDIGWVKHPQFFTPGMRSRLALLTPNTLRRARRVFALTRAIAQEIAEVYGTPIERIDVVSPAVDPVYQPHHVDSEVDAVRQRYHLPSDFVLYTGALQPRKNLTRLATAFSRLVKKGLPHALVIAGRRAWLHKGMLDDIEKLNLGDRIHFTGYVEQADLPCLYAAASAFVYVSIYEGFGLPVLEALASGTPVLGSSIPAIKEVAGDAAVYCHPLDVYDMEAKLDRVLTDTDLRNALRAAGPKRAARFTRKAMANAALEGYRRALER